MIEAKNISKSIDGFQILKDINLTISPQEITVVFGPSGSGKTTLLRSLSLLDVPDNGQLSIDEYQYDFSSVKKNIALPYPKVTVVFQQLFLWPHLTNRENITLALGKKELADSQSRLGFLTRELQMQDYIDKFPNQSSLGQKQRIAIARALILKPNYIFFDEITASLDTIQTSHLIRLIQRINRQKPETGILFVTHNLEVAKMIADKVVFLDKGEIVEIGTSEIFVNPKTEKLKSFLQLTNHKLVTDTNIIWRKTYNLFHKDGNFNIYISSHRSGEYYGAVLYYVQNKSRTDKTSTPAFEFKLEQFVDTTEDGAYSKCVKWVNENLKGKYKIVETEATTF